MDEINILSDENAGQIVRTGSLKFVQCSAEIRKLRLSEHLLDDELNITRN